MQIPMRVNTFAIGQLIGMLSYSKVLLAFERLALGRTA